MNVDPVLFRIFGIEIRWYGFLIALGMLIGVGVALRRAKRVNLSQDNVLDVLIVSIPLAIIGARLYYVIFNWSYYEGDFFKIINFRNGGLAIHGGLLFALIGAVVVCRIKKINFWDMVDLTFPLVALGQAIGRWGNYINQEAHGTETTLPWGILIDGVRVHPTFLYESIGDFLIFILLSLLFYRRKNRGEVFCAYLVLYGILRFFVEGLRTDSLMMGSLRVAQMVSILGAVVGALGLWYIKSRGQKGEGGK